ncbi:LytTR family DNA-binding domain-containing protein [Thalassotalea insulae]|nr:LytTR family DNA-binding domain-containing protein [Thalassotalea insulae]
MKNQMVSDRFNLKKIRHDLLVVSVVGMFIGFLAPFGMDSTPLFLSISFWVCTSVCGYLIYMPTTVLGELVLLPFINRHWLRFAISALLASVIMSFVVPILTWLFFYIPLDYASQFWSMLPKAIIIGTALSIATIVKDHIQHQQVIIKESEQKIEQIQENDDKAGQQLQLFIEQLPVEKRGQLICLEMSDHYLKVHTDKGHHLLLLRFKDALTMLDLVDGMQTHRSWWIAKEAVQSVKRDGRKVILVMINQLEVPVSKTYLDEVKNQHFHV